MRKTSSTFILITLFKGIIDNKALANCSDIGTVFLIKKETNQKSMIYFFLLYICCFIKSLNLLSLVDGGFTVWSEYSKCSATCGGGTQVRGRSCTEPAPAHGGKECEGETVEERECGKDPCPGNNDFTFKI